MKPPASQIRNVFILISVTKSFKETEMMLIVREATSSGPFRRSRAPHADYSQIVGVFLETRKSPITKVVGCLK